MELLKTFFNSERFFIEKTENINLKPFINTYNNNYIDIIKLDTQGTEFEILEGFGNLLHNTKVITTEVEFVEMYIQQKKFDEINKFLKSYNFVLLKFERLVFANINEYHQYKFYDDSYGIITLNKFIKNQSIENDVLIKLLIERDNIIKNLYKKNINNQDNFDQLILLNKMINDIDTSNLLNNDTMMFGDVIYVNLSHINSEITQNILSYF